MFLLSKNGKVLFGNSQILKDSPTIPFNDKICEALSSLSKVLLADPSVKSYPDVVTFAYWCRKSNLLNLKEQFKEDRIRLGAGVLFHITPANVPINFAFSFVFGLLAGNSNIVRIPTRRFEQIDIIINALIEVSKLNDVFMERLLILRYEKSDETTSCLIELCNGKVVWGGDDTINYIRQLPSPPKSFELFFPDRYSICIINADNSDDISKAALGFYNDTYIMDQNACSSPHIVFWVGKKENIESCKHILWNAVADIVGKKYNFQPIMSIDKYEKLCIDAQDKWISSFVSYKNYLYCLHLSKICIPIDKFRGQFGYFYEYYLSDLNELSSYINQKCQTLTYYGFDKSSFKDFVINNELTGIDRIVPIGKALDIGLIWDGRDIIKSLSRICDIV